MRTAFIALTMTLAAAASAAVPCAAPGANPVFPEPPVDYTHVATIDGTWHSASTWGAGTESGSVPGNGDVVCIPPGLRVTVTNTSSPQERIRFIRVDGEMRLWIHSPTRLYVETIYVGPYDPGQAKTGIFMIGAGCCPVKPHVTAEVVFISDGVHLRDKSGWDPQQLSRGFVSDGRVRLYGTDKTHAVTVDPATSPDTTLDPLAGDTALTVESVPSHWKAGDEVVLTGSYFRRGQASRDEVRSLAADVTGTRVDLASGLSHDHVLPGRGVHAEPRLHVANLTRNLVFRSETTSSPWQRAHVMFRSADVDVENVRFEGLGRTDKSIPVDDVDVTVSSGSYSVSIPAAGTYSNPRGRYACHFHENGIQPGSPPPSRVHSSVVVDTAGWGFVNHSSHVEFSENVAHDFVGAGFVTEAGDELGSFTDNLAVRGTGDGSYRLIRIVFKNAARPQPLGDFAFQGDGFWFQGPALTVRDNVANGCNGAGMIWFTTGVAETFQGGGGQVVNRYVGFPRGAVSSVYAGASTPNPDPSKLRNWNHDANELVTADLPILDFDGFQGYGNFIGLKHRFNNDDSVDWYKEDPFDYDLRIQSPAQVSRARQEAGGLLLWNNEQAFRLRYVERTDVCGVKAVNRLDYEAGGNGATRGIPGAEYNFQILDSSFQDLTIDGYPLAGWIENRSEAVRNQIQFVNAPTYLRYAQDDTWNKGAPGNYPTCELTCTAPSGLSAQPGAFSTVLSWTGSSIDDRYLVRYRADGEQAWEMVETTGTSVAVSLDPGIGYTFHVASGCSQTKTCPHKTPGQPSITRDLEGVSAWSGGHHFQN